MCGLEVRFLDKFWNCGKFWVFGWGICWGEGGLGDLGGLLREVWVWIGVGGFGWYDFGLFSMYLLY